MSIMEQKMQEQMEGAEYLQQQEYELAENIIKAMFKNYSFSFKISIPKMKKILFIINTDNIIVNNNQITLFIKDITENQIEIQILTKNNKYNKLGIYNINNDIFIKESDFWEILFLEYIIH